MADNSTREWSKRPIKECTTEQMENAIATAISTLTGTTYEVEIASIDHAPKGVGIIDDTTDIRLRVARPKGWLIRQQFGATAPADKSTGNPS